MALPCSITGIVSSWAARKDADPACTESKTTAAPPQGQPVTILEGPTPEEPSQTGWLNNRWAEFAAPRANTSRLQRRLTEGGSGRMCPACRDAARARGRGRRPGDSYPKRQAHQPGKRVGIRS